MSPFWAGLFENLQGRGRNAALFVVALPTLLITTLIALKVPDEVFRDYLLPALPWVALVAVLWAIRAFLRIRARHRERLGRSALSLEEMRKARSKLVKCQTPAAAKNSLVPPG